MRKPTDIEHIDTSTAKVECPQGHRYTIADSAVERHAGHDAYECPKCEHMVDAMNAMRRYGFGEQA